MILDKKFIENLKRSELKDIIGQEEAKRQIKSALISGRNVIIVGPPGVGKTTLAKNIAKLLPEKRLSVCPYHCDPKNPICPECRRKKEEKKEIKTRLYKGEELFIRVQGSPELTPEDLIGDIDPIKALKYGPTSIEAFTPGKIFMANNGILFFDEINRTTEKLQNALLQVLEEGYITLAGFKIDLPVNFILIATMNPEDKSTEALSDVFLDRFDIIHMDYPRTKEEEKEIVKREAKINHFNENLMNIAVGFVRELRGKKELEKRPSVRATIGIIERASALAEMEGREVEISDIFEVANSVLCHRIRLKPSIRYTKSEEEFLNEFAKEWRLKLEKGGYL